MAPPAGGCPTVMRSPRDPSCGGSRSQPACPSRRIAGAFLLAQPGPVGCHRPNQPCCSWPPRCVVPEQRQLCEPTPAAISRPGVARGCSCRSRARWLSSLVGFGSASSPPSCGCSEAVEASARETAARRSPAAHSLCSESLEPIVTCGISSRASSAQRRSGTPARAGASLVRPRAYPETAKHQTTGNRNFPEFPKPDI